MSSDNFNYTVRAVEWVMRALGPAILKSRRERAMRFFEEATELAQACGLAKHDMAAIVDRVMHRPSGEVAQESAGAYFTLLVLAHAHDVSLDWELMKEFRRVEDPAVVARIREKHAGKVAEGTSNVPVELTTKETQ